MPPARSSPSVTGLHDRLLDGLRELLLASDRVRQQAASTLGLSLNDLTALSYLGATDRLGQQDLAQRLGLTASATTSLVDRLETLGLARRRPHPTDRRRTLVHLSPAGAQTVGRVRDLYSAALSGMAEADLAAAPSFLEQFSSRLRDVVQGPVAE